MRKLYTQRKAPPKTELIYRFDEQVRQRMLATLEDHVSDFWRFLDDLGHDLVKVYGYLQRSAYDACRTSDNAVIEHLFCCDEEEVLDYFEAAFHQKLYRGQQDGVDELNSILEIEGIGYRFSDYPASQKRKKGGPPIHFPEGHRLTEGFTYSTVVKPVLHFLVADGFDIAHDELMRALAAFRQGEAEDALTLAGAAYESFLKSLMAEKRWPFDPEKDACAALVKQCVAQGLIPSFYEACLVAPGTIRNKLSDAHGRGPKIQHEASPEAADHMIHLVCSNILFLRECAAS